MNACMHACMLRQTEGADTQVLCVQVSVLEAWASMATLNHLQAGVRFREAANVRLHAEWLLGSNLRTRARARELPWAKAANCMYQYGVVARRPGHAMQCYGTVPCALAQDLCRTTVRQDASCTCAVQIRAWPG